MPVVHGGAAVVVVVTHWPPLAELYVVWGVHFGVFVVVTQFPELSTVPVVHGGAAVVVVVTHWPPLAEVYVVLVGYILVYLYL